MKSKLVIDGMEYVPEEIGYSAADVVITIGGDGTLLHETPKAIRYNKPVLGINVGRVGFLAVCEPSEMEEKLTRVATGDYKLDRRALLAVKKGNEVENVALNEVSISNGLARRTISFSIACDNIPVAQFRGDGVLISTPTGSTAYSLAAGGPIVDAKTRALLMTPVCATGLYAVPMVFAAERVLTVITNEASNNATVLCDGRRKTEVMNGEPVEITLSSKYIDLIAFNDAEQFLAIDRKLRGKL